ncbi:MAG: hypothetical protein AB1401_00475 [Thermodesulfobacteriota bacterium]
MQVQTVKIKNHSRIDQIVYDRAFDPTIVRPGDTVEGEFFVEKTKGLTITKVKSSDVKMRQKKEEE